MNFGVVFKLTVSYRNFSINMDIFYYKSEEEFEKIHHGLKQRECPHCRIIGSLILHGYLKGYAPGSFTDRCSRGHRIFCSNRGKRKGCGRTFSIIMSMFMRGFTFCTKLISGFLKGLLKGHAAARVPESMSVSSAYRIRKMFDINQPFIREKLLNKTKPPFCLFPDPLHKTINHLQFCFPVSEDPVQAFQLHLQIPFFRESLPHYGLIRKI